MLLSPIIVSEYYGRNGRSRLGSLTTFTPFVHSPNFKEIPSCPFTIIVARIVARKSKFCKKFPILPPPNALPVVRPLCPKS
jgi:hypothetical protein